MSSLQRFFARYLQPGLKTIIIAGKEQKHIRASRLKPGDFLELFNGKGMFVKGKIVQFRGKMTEVEILEELENGGNYGPPYSLRVTLAVGMPKGDHAEYLLEKVTEVGASEVIPLITKRSVMIPNSRNKEDASR